MQFTDAEFLAFGEDFQRAIGAILDPSRKPKPPSLSLRRCAKVDALDPAPDLKLKLLERHTL